MAADTALPSVNDLGKMLFDLCILKSIRRDIDMAIYIIVCMHWKKQLGELPGHKLPFCSMLPQQPRSPLLRLDFRIALIGAVSFVFEGLVPGGASKGS